MTRYESSERESIVVEIIGFRAADGLEIYAEADPAHPLGYKAAHMVADSGMIETLRPLFDAEKFDGQEFADVNAQWLARVELNVETTEVGPMEINGELLADNAEPHELPVTVEVMG